MLTRSEQLFQQQRTVAETSTLANSAFIKNIHSQPKNLLRTHQEQSHWYRMILRYGWSFMGLSALDIGAIMANIASATAPRSNYLLDTVVGYRPGCWCYEWLRHSVSLASKEQFLPAAMAACIADYPHLRHDPLGVKAHPLMNSYYKKAMNLRDDVEKFEQINIEIAGKVARGYLHLPTTEQSVPLVIVLADWSQLYPEWFALYREGLAKAGIAMLVIEFFGSHGLSDFAWQQHSVKVYQRFLEAMIDSPYILSTHIALLGYRFSVPTAVKLAQLNCEKIHNVICLEPAVSSLFSQVESNRQLPQMFRDGLASFLGSDSSQWPYVAAQLQPFSLKAQGLLKRRSWPGQLLVIYHQSSLLANKDDIKELSLMADTSEQVVLKGPDFSDQPVKVAGKVVHWLKNQLSYG
ncbi:alpha/beta hydrolase [Celerinatantimonas sp. MCCC 1A17872]|uniref:alpha/beta hydrolase n=1 Tax=Celerinatantimonas sp. MCCC 1A17872 TaxID=3177514 RepID=UPI0038C56779